VLVDTHCHLGDGQFDSDRESVVERARQAGVGHVVIIADALPTTATAIALATKLGLSATAGIHPHEAATWNAASTDRLREALSDPTVVAVGETGLDYHYDHAPRQLQRRAFEAQLTLASSLGLPVVIHARDADDDIAAFVREWGTALPALVLHSFSSGPAAFEAGMDVGAYFGFSGMVTFKNWQHDAAVTACPLERLLLETDAPYLAPVPHRGTRNEPAYVRHVAARVAALRGLTLDDVERQTTLNAGRCFGARVLEPFGNEP
jgi:TatD DNase family protein